MLVKGRDFTRLLTQQNLPTIVWITGDEPLLVDEASIAMLDYAQKQDYHERQIIDIEANFDWSLLQHYSAERSLFDERKILDIRLRHLKPGKQGGEVIRAWAANIPEEVTILIRSGKVDAATQKTKWFQAISAQGWVVQFWSLSMPELVQWIIARGRTHQLSIERSAAELLAAQTEGNLLATGQEISKLGLLHAGATVDATMVIEAVADNYRFDVFSLVDAVLAGNSGRSHKIYHALLKEGVAVQIIIWALARDLRELVMMQKTRNRPSAYKPLEPIHPAIWKKRIPLFTEALKRTLDYATLLQKLAELDWMSKGMREGDVYLELERLVIGMSGGSSIT
jgi:DNA polymerase III subunit delta